MTRRKHYNLILEWAADSDMQIETQHPETGEWVLCERPSFRETLEYRKVDPYRHLREAIREGKTIEKNMGSNVPKWVDVRTPLTEDYQFASPPERYRIKSDYPLQYDDLKNGEIYVTQYPGQGLFIFKQGYKCWGLIKLKENAPKQFNTTYIVTSDFGNFTPWNGFDAFRIATEEEKKLLK